MEFQIQKASKDDALKMNELLTKLIQDEKQYDKNIDDNFVVESFYEHYVDDPNKCLLVAKNKDNILGYIYGYIKTHEDGLNASIVAKLDAIYVEENYRRNNIAKELIKEFKSWCKNNKATSLEVDVCSKNIKSFKLYQECGFEEFKKSLKMDI